MPRLLFLTLSYRGNALWCLKLARPGADILRTLVLTFWRALVLAFWCALSLTIGAPWWFNLARPSPDTLRGAPWQKPPMLGKGNLGPRNPTFSLPEKDALTKDIVEGHFVAHKCRKA